MRLNKNLSFSIVHWQLISQSRLNTILEANNQCQHLLWKMYLNTLQSYFWSKMMDLTVGTPPIKGYFF